MPPKKKKATTQASTTPPNESLEKLKDAPKKKKANKPKKKHSPLSDGANVANITKASPAKKKKKPVSTTVSKVSKKKPAFTTESQLGSMPDSPSKSSGLPKKKSKSADDVLLVASKMSGRELTLPSPEGRTKKKQVSGSLMENGRNKVNPSLVKSKAVSMRHLNSPEKSIKKPVSLRAPVSRRLPPARTKSAEGTRTQPRTNGKRMTMEGVQPSRKVPPRSRSGDLELVAGSSMHHRTDLPPSILRNSGHHPRQQNTNSSKKPRKGTTKKRFNASFSDSFEVNTIDEGSDFSSSSLEHIDIKFDSPVKQRSMRPGMGSRPGLKKNKSMMDLSAHSELFKSTLNVMSVDKVEEWPGDPLWKKTCRYLRLLPPHPEERPEKRRIRIYVWASLFLDFVAAMVSITTYNGVATCCGVPIFSLVFVNVNWTQAIRIMTYVYLVMIFMEIIPVVRKGIPFNLLNPLLGFTITFAMFFDDRITEAILMWIIEAAAIFLEFLVFRIQNKMFHDRYDQLDDIQEELNPYLKSSRNLDPKKSSRHMRQSTHSSKRLGLNGHVPSRAVSTSHSRHLKSTLSSNSAISDEDSLSGHSFGDDGDEDDLEEQTMHSFASKISSGSPGQSSNHKLHKSRLLRQRRMLRQRQKEDRVQLNYHLAGSMINLVLAGISFILIVVIASSGGLCVISGSRPVVFDMNQLDKCSECRGNIIDGLCEICSGEEYQCYYQYI